MKIEDFRDTKKLHKKLKIDKTKLLAKKTLGDLFLINSVESMISIRGKVSLFDKLVLNKKPPILFTIRSDDNSFTVYEKNYFEQAIKLADKYEEFFEKEVTVNQSSYPINN